MTNWKRLWAAVLCLCLLAGLLTACGREAATGADASEAVGAPGTDGPESGETADAPAPDYIEYEVEGSRLYLPAGQELLLNMSNFDVALGSEAFAVLAVQDTRQEFTDAGVDFPADLAAYTALVEENNGAEEPFAQDELGSTFTEYTTEVQGKAYYYYVVLTAGEDSYWTVNFTCLEKDKETYRDRFAQWASLMELA